MPRKANLKRDFLIDFNYQTFVGALILAGNYQIPEACVYFNHQLMRGNRTIKVSAGNLDAFHSPNMTPLVKVGIDIEVDYRSIHRYWFDWVNCWWENFNLFPLFFEIGNHRTSKSCYSQETMWISTFSMFMGLKWWRKNVIFWKWTIKMVCIIGLYKNNLPL